MATKPTILNSVPEGRKGNDNPPAKPQYSTPADVDPASKSLTSGPGYNGKHRVTILNKVMRTCPNCGNQVSDTHQCN